MVAERARPEDGHDCQVFASIPVVLAIVLLFNVMASELFSSCIYDAVT